MRQTLQTYLQYLDKMADSGQAFDIKKMSENLTIDTIACCAFATHTNAIDDPNGPFISQCRKLVDMKASKFLLVLALSKQHYT